MKRGWWVGVSSAGHHEPRAPGTLRRNSAFHLCELHLLRSGARFGPSEKNQTALVKKSAWRGNALSRHCAVGVHQPSEIRRVVLNVCPGCLRDVLQVTSPLAFSSPMGLWLGSLAVRGLCHWETDPYKRSWGWNVIHLVETGNDWGQGVFGLESNNISKYQNPLWNRIVFCDLF